MINNTPPDLAWPRHLDENLRKIWHRAVILEYLALWEDDVTEAMFTPATNAQITALEADIGCQLPIALKHYHQIFGVLELGERLNSLNVQDDDYRIAPLLDAYPGIVDMALTETEMDLVKNLIVFGDYLGNGNMWCFHRQSQKIYYFDHDSAPQLTLFFDDCEQYLDALMIRSLAEIHDDDDAGEKVLAEKIDKKLIKKWLY